MEIERKFLVARLPELTEDTPKKVIEQGYVSTWPVIRIRRSNDDYILTIKGKGLLQREEFELMLDNEQYDTLKKKVDNYMICKTRYLLPYNGYTIELDIFENQLQGLIVAEVEFPNLEAANSFSPPGWFGKDVTEDRRYQNSHLCRLSSMDAI